MQELAQKPERATVTLQPRLVRMRDAPGYLGMDRNRFNAEVRPFLTEVPLGTQGIAFDRLDLDAWADQYIQRNGRAPTKGGKSWDANESPASEKPEMYGTKWGWKADC